MDVGSSWHEASEAPIVRTRLIGAGTDAADPAGTLIKSIPARLSMKALQTNSDRLRQDLRDVVHDIEGIVQGLADATHDEAGELKARTRTALNHVRDRLGEIEHDAATRLRTTGARTQRYVHERPWLVIGAAAAAAFVLGTLVKLRR